MKYKEKYPALRQLLAGGFNQDWDCDYDSPEEVIHDFAESVYAPQLIDELKKLLQEEHAKEEWDRIFYEELGCDYDVERAEGLIPKQWLQKALNQLEREKHLKTDTEDE